MSITVKIRTDKHPAPKDVFEALVERGESIIVTSPNYPYVKFGYRFYALFIVYTQ